MSSLSTKTNKSRSTSSGWQTKAAAKSSIKKTTPAKGAKKPVSQAAAGTGKASNPAVRTSPAKKPAAKPASAKSTTGKTAKKPIAAKGATKTADVQPRKNSAQESRAAVEAFEKALKLFSQQDFAAAKSAFEQILVKFSAQSDVLSGVRKYLAVVEQRLARTPAPPKNPEALYDRGVFEFNKANFQEAINLFEKALKAQPDAAHVFYSVAAAYARLSNTKKAIEALRQATNLQSALRSRARSDHDFTSLHNNDDFRYMTGYGFDSQD